MAFLLNKILTIKDKILTFKNGAVYIFALIKRNDLEDKWDIIISADWIKESNNQEDLVEVIKLLRNEFSSDLDFLSKIVLLEKKEPLILDIAKAISQYSLETGYVGELRVSDDLTIGEINLVHINLSDFNSADLEINVSEKKVVDKQDFN